MLIASETAPNVSTQDAGKRIMAAKDQAASAVDVADKALPKKKPEAGKKALKKQVSTKKPAPETDEAPEADEAEEQDLDDNSAAGDVDEGTEGEAEAHSDEEQGEEAEDEGADEDEAGELHTVIVDGKELHVPYEELVAGYQRQADYTRKTSSLAKERKDFETSKEAVKDLPQVRETYQKNGEKFAKNAGLVLAALEKRFMPKPPDASLAKTDPGAFLEAKERHQEALQFVGGIYQEMAGMEREVKAEHSKRLTEGKAKLYEAEPELKDDASRNKLISYAKGLGYSDEQLSNEADHRLFQMAYKAMKYDEIMNRKKELVPGRNRARVMKQTRASEGKQAVQRRQRTETLQRHSKEGSVNSAAAAINSLIRK